MSILNFNNQEILKTCLVQTLPKIGLQNLEKRIYVGASGGLAYLLFRPPCGGFLPHGVVTKSIDQMDDASEYFDAVR